MRPAVSVSGRPDPPQRSWISSAATDTAVSSGVRPPTSTSALGMPSRFPSPAAVIALVDQPLIGAGVVRRLVAAYRDGAELAVAAYHGRARNPVLLARRHWAGVIATAEGDTGARPYLRAHPGLVTLVECADIGAPDDVDTPEDLARVGALLSGEDSGAMHR